MIDADKLVAFAVVSGTTSLVPGPSMLFVMGQASWRGERSGAAALAGVQLGYVFWWILAALGLGTLAVAFPLFFHLLAIGGAAYLAWLGAQALRHAGAADDRGEPALKPSAHAFRDGIFVAISNPKALVYIVALLPPFVNADSAVVPQLLVLAAVAMAIDVALGGAYIALGARLATAMENERTRKWLDRGVGAVFILIGLAILIELFRR